MMNMSHCRFHNTVAALRECQDALSEMNDPATELPEAEYRAFQRLLKRCRELADDFDDEA